MGVSPCLLQPWCAVGSHYLWGGRQISLPLVMSREWGRSACGPSLPESPGGSWTSLSLPALRLYSSNPCGQNSQTWRHIQGKPKATYAISDSVFIYFQNAPILKHPPCYLLFLKLFLFFPFSWFTVFCQFLLYSKVTQSHAYISMHFFLTLFFIMLHHQ